MEDNKDSITNPLNELAIGMAASANSIVSPSSPRLHSSGRREDRLNRFPLIGQKVYVHPRRDKQGNVRMDLPTLPIRRAEGDEKRVRKELGLSKKQWKKLKRREREETDKMWRDDDTTAVAREYKRELKEQAAKKTGEEI